MLAGEPKILLQTMKDLGRFGLVKIVNNTIVEYAQYGDAMQRLMHYRVDKETLAKRIKSHEKKQGKGFFLITHSMMLISQN